MATTSKKEKKAKGEKTVIDNSPEAKAARFKKIAARRTQKICTTLSNLGNCANKNVYSYTEEQLEIIFTAISKALASCKEKFAEKAAKEKVKSIVL